MVEQSKLTVFYDGSCPLCTREIGLYRGCAGADDLTWVDVAASDDPIVMPGLTKAEAMRRFHVMHPDGRIVSGGGAFADLWNAIPGLAWFGRIFQGKPWRCLLDGAYTLILPARPMLQRLVRLATKRA